MAGSTPTRDARSSRLHSKPYDRPSSASSSVTNTPQKPVQGGGLFRSLVEKLYSPFHAKDAESSGRFEASDSRKEKANRRDDEVKRVADDDRNSEGLMAEKDQHPRSDDDPIEPILAAIESLAPITPELSTMLLSSFMARKQALGQAGQQTPEEQQAISELLRRATEDTGKSSVLGVSTSSTTSRSPMISRTGRGLFDIPVRDKGLARSSSHSALAGSPARPRTSNKISLGSPATPWRPLHNSTLGKTQSLAVPDSSASQSQKQAEKTGVAEPGNSGQPSHTSSAPRQAGALLKSTSMFTLSKHDRNRNTASPDFASANKVVAPTAHSAENAQMQPRQIKSAAARTLEGLLSQEESETDKKLHVEPVSNPYEGYRFHIGSSSTALSKSSSRMGSTSSRPRISLKPRPRASLVPPAPDTSKMTDLELIEASINAEQNNKRSRMTSPRPTAPSRLSDDAESRMQVDEPSAAPAAKQKASEPRIQPQINSIFARAKSPIKKQLNSLEETTTPRQPPPSKFSAFDIISRTIANSAEPEKTARMSLPFSAPSPVEQSAVFKQLKESTKAPSSPITETPEDIVKKLDASALPIRTFRSLASTPDLSKDSSPLSRQQSLATPINKLPTFTFTFKLPATPGAPAAPAATAPSTAFTGWGTGVVPKIADDMWECTTCMCKSKPTSTKCDVCETPRPVAKPASTTTNTGFTGWGAGAAKPTTASSEWTCSVCMCKSKPASTKCDVCESPRPAGESAPSTVVNTGFTGWGAGAQSQAKSSGTWTCSVCGLQSKETSTKCDVCEAPR